MPSGNNVDAMLGDVIQQARTVVVDEDIVLRSLTFDNANTYAVAGTGVITFEHVDAATGGHANIDVTQGSHQFQTSVSLSSDTDVDVANGAMLMFNNVLELGGNTLTKMGPGTVAINNQLNTGGGTINVMEGTVSGSGIIGGDVVNDGGTISPGNSPGIIAIVGNLTQSSNSTLLMEIAGLASSAHDVLSVGGVADLDGTLIVELLAGFQPAEGSEFELFQFQTVSGEFDSIQLPPLSRQLQWDTSRLYVDGTISVVAVPEPGTSPGMWLGLVVFLRLGTLAAKRSE